MLHLVFAHLGHGDPRWSSTVLHYLIEPQHAWPTLIVVAAAIALFVHVRRRGRA